MEELKEVKCNFLIPELTHIILKYKVLLEKPDLTVEYVLNLVKLIKLISPGCKDYWRYTNDIIHSYQKTLQIPREFYNREDTGIYNLKALAPGFMRYPCYIDHPYGITLPGRSVININVDNSSIDIRLPGISEIQWSITPGNNNEYVLQVDTIYGAEIKNKDEDIDEPGESEAIYPNVMYICGKDATPESVVDLIVDISKKIEYIIDSCCVPENLFEIISNYLDPRSDIELKDVDFGELYVSEFLRNTLGNLDKK